MSPSVVSGSSPIQKPSHERDCFFVGGTTNARCHVVPGLVISEGEAAIVARASLMRVCRPRLYTAEGSGRHTHGSTAQCEQVVKFTLRGRPSIEIKSSHMQVMQQRMQ